MAVGTKTYFPFVHDGNPDGPVASEGHVGKPEDTDDDGAGDCVAV